MSVLSRQVTAVSQELQEMTSLLKPLFHNPSTLLMASTVARPPSVSSHSCSPAPPLFTQHAPVDCSDNHNPPSVLVAEPPSPHPSMTELLQGELDPIQCPPSQTLTSRYPPVSHRSAPPSLNSSPHEHTVMPHPSSISIPFLSSSSHPSSITPLLVDLSGPDSQQPQSRLLLVSQSESQFTSSSYPRTLSQSQLQPLLQPSSMASHPEEPLLDLQEWSGGEHTTQLSFINEGQPPM